MKVHILHVIDRADAGGAQMMLYQLARVLRDQFSLSIIVLGTSGHFADAYRSLGIPVEEIGRGIGKWNPRPIFSLMKTIRRQRPDIIHAHLFKSNILAVIAAWWSGCRVILHDHVGLYPPISEVFLPNRFSRRIYLLAFRYALQHCDRLIVLLPNMVEPYQHYYSLPLEKIILLPNAIDLELYSREKGNRLQRPLWRELGLPSETRFITMVGRLEPEKDWDTFLNVAKEFTVESSVPCVFLAVGHGSQAARLKTIAENNNLKNVYFLGNRTDVPAILAQSDIFLLTSRREACSLALLEAMASGCAVVATRNGGSDVMLSDGVDGLLCSVGDVQALSQAVEKLLIDDVLSKRLRSKALDKVMESYNLDVIGERIARVYQEMLDL
jgi:glycosyltransferase involved in cell wall biosynthesis